MGKPYRVCVVGVFINDNGEVLVGERNDNPGAWQLPQGGVDEGETFDEAIRREMREELGIRDVSVQFISNEFIHYDFPPELSAPVAKKFRGQSMIWCKLSLIEGDYPNLDFATDKEFRSFRWVKWQKAAQEITPWKKEAYKTGFKSLGLSGD